MQNTVNMPSLGSRTCLRTHRRATTAVCSRNTRPTAAICSASTNRGAAGPAQEVPCSHDSGRRPWNTIPTIHCAEHQTDLASGPRGSGLAMSAACTLGMWQLWLAESVLAADEAAAYNPTGGKGLFENIAGVAYIVLVGFFLFKVFTRRAKRAKEQRIAGSPEGAEGEIEPSIFEQLRVRLNQNIDPARQTGPLDAFLGAAQAGLLAAGLFAFSSKLQGVLDATELPDGYTARNISLTVRTILSGLCWLATFIFGANSVGLLGLTFQWLLFPDSIKDDEEELARRRALQEQAGPQLPKVSVASKPDELLKAFQQAERLGKLESLSTLSSSSSVDDSSSDSVTVTSASGFSGTRAADQEGFAEVSVSRVVVPSVSKVTLPEEPVFVPEPIKASPFSKQEQIEGAADLAERMR